LSFSVLAKSNQSIKETLGRLSEGASDRPATHFTASDRQTIAKSAKEMAPIDARMVEKRTELEAANNELKLIEPMYNGVQGPLYVDFSGVDERSLKTKIADLERDLSP
jgi:hypothetical protein